MGTTIGVVGPVDLTDDVATITEEQPGVRAIRYDYDHESEAPGIVEAHSGSVDAWLFTGVVPYTLAQEAKALSRPAGFVEYTGATLLAALVQLLRDGYDITRVSVDTLSASDVQATFAEAGTPTEGVKTLHYRADLTSADVVAFHRRAHRARPGTGAAITCLASVYEVLHQEMPVLRLAPSAHSVRIALRQLLLSATTQLTEDAQIALGLVELSGDAEGLLKESVALGGSLARFKAGVHLLVTTRGPLSDATAEFTSLPMLRRLAEHHDVVRIGFGLGRTAADAENLARRALGRARRLGDVAAVLSLRDDTDIVLAADLSDVTRTETNLTVLAQRVGLAVPTLERLQQVRVKAGETPLTTRDVADQLGVQQRTARRMLHRLERAGLAERAGNRPAGSSGRPLTLYHLTL
ncbi:MAG: hypothetical protein ACRDTU_15030 [Micromonosporaceae bacterium]